MSARLILAAALAVGTIHGAAAQGAAATTSLFQGFSANSPDPVEVEADGLEVEEQEDQRISIFRGNVTVHRGAMTMKAIAITIFSDAKPQQGNTDAFNRLEANGKVYITQGDQTATGDAAVFDSKAQTATLTGNVVLTQGASVIAGNKLTVDIKAGRARVEQAAGGRIRGVFTPGAAAATGPGAKPAAAPAGAANSPRPAGR